MADLEKRDYKREEQKGKETCRNGRPRKEGRREEEPGKGRDERERERERNKQKWQTRRRGKIKERARKGEIREDMKDLHGRRGNERKGKRGREREASRNVRPAWNRGGD